MTPEPFLDAAHELDVSHRRILQLEAALMRRTELLEQKQAELANIKASRAYQFVHSIQKLFNRVFPIHSRRRAFVRSGVRSAGHMVGWVLNARQSRNGPSPEARHLTEATPHDEYRRWIKRNTISVKVAPLALGIITLVLVPTIAPALWLCVVGLGRVRKRRAFQQLRARQSAALPDLVDMIRLCVASGCTPYGSLVVLGSLPLRADDVLGPLLVEAAEALRGGAVVGDVLEEFQSVVGEAARPLCSALRSSADSGTPITETLDLLAREARRARKAQADVAAKRLPVLLLFPLITCILPAFALLAIVPLLGGALSALHW